MTIPCQSRWLLTVVVTLIVGAIYSPGFFGFWHGDDLPNLIRAHSQFQQQTLWSETFRLFFAPVPSDGAFYRPMMMLSLAANYAAFKANYAGWYLINFAVHLVNTALVALVVRRLAGRCECDATIAAPLAAFFFGLSPILAEGVYWVSARSDGWVTLLTLAGAYAWAGTPRKIVGVSAFGLPLFIVFALGFKESAAVVPLQILLLAMAWPDRLSRSQRWALATTFVVAGLFLAWRVWLFGDAWHVYTPAPTGGRGMHVRLWHSLLSLPPWWQAMTLTTPIFAAAYWPITFIGGIGGFIAVRQSQARLALALLGASAGLALATLLNLGGMSSTGEGGRLSYGPMAWLAVALGLLMSMWPETPNARKRANTVAIWAIAAAALVGTNVLERELRRVWSTQSGFHALTRAVPAWAQTHTGLTMLLIPENDGAVVLGRNAQGGIVLPPVQAEPYLHRVVPTLKSEVNLRQDQFCNGLAKRLELIRPRDVDKATMDAIFLPAETVWPAHVACWRTREQRIVALTPPPMDSACRFWLDSIRGDIAKCGD